MTSKTLRLIARNLEGVAMLLEAGSGPERELASELRDEISLLRRLANTSEIHLSLNRPAV